MFWTIIGLLILFWLLGLVAHILGWIVHLLLIAAVVLLIAKGIKKLL
ncbi:MAG TPA: lmo0937 family membrane protein [Bacillales bacterium]|nr:lmo0937 family membrane protein [Bacillales bacterium]